jgi:hypothetical protein
MLEMRAVDETDAMLATFGVRRLDAALVRGGSTPLSCPEVTIWITFYSLRRANVFVSR